MKETGTIDNSHQHEEYAVGDEGSSSEQKPANQNPTLEINVQKDSSSSSQACAKSSMGQEQAQPIQHKLVQQLPNVKISLEKEACASWTNTNLQMLQEQAPTTQPQEIKVAAEYEEPYVPPARIVMSVQSKDGSQIQRLALIDMSADKNMMSHHTWCLLGKPNLSLTSKFVQKSTNVFSECLGVIEICLEIDYYCKIGKFFVMALGNLQEEILLSRAWMSKCNCTIGWTYRHMSFLNADQELVVVKLVQVVPQTSLGDFRVHKISTKKLKKTTGIYKEKGKAKVESTSPSSTNPLVSTLTTFQKCLTDHLTKEQKASLSTATRTSNMTQQRSHQSNKVYQPK